MKTVVWKYPVDGDRARVVVPSGAKIIDVQPQSGTLQLWAMVDPDESRSQVYRVDTVGTGHKFDSSLRTSYISTWRNGPFVFHSFATLESEVT